MTEIILTEDKTNEPFNLDDTSEALHLFDIDFDVAANHQLDLKQKNLSSNLDDLDQLDGFLLIQVDDQEPSKSHELLESSLESSNDELTSLFPSLLRRDFAEEADLFLDPFIEDSEEVKLPMPDLLANIFSDSSTKQILDVPILVSSDDETELQGVNWNGRENLIAIENSSKNNFEDDWTKFSSPESWAEINDVENSVLEQLEGSFDQLNFDMSNDSQDFDQDFDKSEDFKQSEDDDNMFWDLSESIENLEASMLFIDQLSNLNLDGDSGLSETPQNQDYPTSDVDTAIEESPIYQNNNNYNKSDWGDFTSTNIRDREILHPALNLNVDTAIASSNDATIRMPLNHLELLGDLSEELLIRKSSLDVYLSEARTLAEEAHRSQHLLNSQSSNSQSSNSQSSFDRLSHVLNLAEQQVSVMSQDVQYLQKLSRQALNYPISSIVKQFPRILRDLCLQYDKRIDLIVQGAEVGIERSLSAIISEALELLLHSACEHRIESPSERKLHGKETQGKIEIIAIQTDDSTIITIIDDGRGFENLSNSMSYSQSDVMLSAIKKKLWEVEGTISVQSQIGKGSEFTIVLPNTLTLMRVLLINIDQMRLAIPSKSVLEVLPMQISENTKGEQETLLWRDRVIPIVKINTFLKLNCRHNLNQSSLLLQAHLQTNPSRQSTGRLESDKSAVPSFVVIQQGKDLFALKTDGCGSEQEVTFCQIEGDISLPKIFNGTVILGNNQAVTLLNPSELVGQCLSSRSNNFVLNSHSEHSGLDDLSDLCDFFGATDPPHEFNSPSVVDQTVQWLGRSPQPKILIVESSANVRRYLAMTLSKSGFVTEQVQNGKEAIAFLNKRLQTGLDIDIVITDLEMPQMEGFKLLTDIRADTALHGLAIVVLTARNNENDQKLALELGANAYFSKPYREEELVKTLQQIVCQRP